MKATIKLNGMRFYAYHGVMPQERKVGNQFIVNLEIEAPVERAVETDHLDDTISYASVYEVVKNEMQIPSQLLEHAGGRMLSAIKEAFPQITGIHLELEKLNPPFGGDVYSASITLRESYNS